jgi:outer membrane protein assembly factor BamD
MLSRVLTNFMQVNLPISFRFLQFSFVLVLLGSVAQAALIYRPGQGWEVEGQDRVAETSREQLEKGETYEKDGKLEEAAGAYRALVKTWPLSPNSPEAQYRFSVILFKLYDFEIAFKEFQKCLEKYPETTHFDDILKHQYEIACLFLAGERQKVWKIPTLPSMEKTVEMFEQVIKNGPYSKVAAMAQLKIGFAREKQKLWDDAVKAYQDVIRRYPKSDLADDAQFQIGYAYMSAAKEADYDQTATNRAIIGFQDYITKYPSSEKIVQAKENIARLQGEQARGLMNIAEFYDRDGKIAAALVYYNSVLQKYPNTDLAKRASRRAEELQKQTSSPKNSKEPKAGKKARDKGVESIPSEPHQTPS